MLTCEREKKQVRESKPLEGVIQKERKPYIVDGEPNFVIDDADDGEVTERQDRLIVTKRQAFYVIVGVAGAQPRIFLMMLLVMYVNLIKLWY